MPRRIQRKREKGWRMPQGTVYVGRPTRWGNHFVVKRENNGKFAVYFGHDRETKRVTPVGENYETYREAAAIAASLFRGLIFHCNLEPLRGKDLACWCPLDQPCHADVLLELANKEGTECST